MKQTLLFVEMPDSISWYHLSSQPCSRGVFSIMVGWGSVRWGGVGVVWLTMPTTLAHSFDATLSGVQSRITCTVSFTQLLSACLREAHLHMHNFPNLACISRILLKFSWYVPGKCCDAKGHIGSVGWRRRNHGIGLRAMKKISNGPPTKIGSRHSSNDLEIAYPNDSTLTSHKIPGTSVQCSYNSDRVHTIVYIY